MNDDRIFCDCCCHWVDDWLQGSEEDQCADCETGLHDE